MDVTSRTGRSLPFRCPSMPPGRLPASRPQVRESPNYDKDETKQPWVIGFSESIGSDSR